MNRLRLSILLFAGLIAREASAGVAQFKGFPTRKLIYIRVPAQPPESAVKLPPEAPPGPLPSHVDVEKDLQSVEAPIVSKPVVDAEATRKSRIISERARLNRNAFIWQQERAAAGSATAQRSLAMRYLTGDAVEKDEARGMDLLRIAAAGGDSAAQKELAKREPAKKE